MAPLAFDEAARAALAAGARHVAAGGLVVGSAGNLSMRSGDRVLITPRGALLEAVDPAECVEIALEDGAVAADHAAASRPSSEEALHRAIYAATSSRPPGAIVHTHSRYATVLGTLVDELPAIHYTINAFGGPVRVARYECFGTDALAAAVMEAMEGRSAALMANHGAVVAGHDVEHAVAKAIQLEWLASIHYDAIVAGTPSILSQADLDAVRARARELREGAEVAAR
jgi:L-fuculose-phosphate aldolase